MFVLEIVTGMTSTSQVLRLAAEQKVNRRDLDSKLSQSWKQNPKNGYIKEPKEPTKQLLKTINGTEKFQS